MISTGTFSCQLQSSEDLDPLINACGDKKLVLLGESSHGTHEFYTWRSAITKRLIAEKGFTVIAVEGDWPDCYKLNRFVKGFDDQDKKSEEILSCFNRWPTWMWANWEIAALLNWLREHNAGNKHKAGFYGLDVYSLWESMETLVTYLRQNDPDAAKLAEHALSCFSAYGRDERNYALHALRTPCRDELVSLLREVRMKAPAYNHDPEAELNTVQNAYVAVEAEKYYRNMVSLNDQTWNIRDQHMMNSLQRILDFHGPDAKAIIWEHNTHVGDARYTDMSAQGQFNLGQLARQQYPSETFIAGFGTYAGTVVAGREWGAEMEVMDIPPARKDSLEARLHDLFGESRMFLFGQDTHEEHFSRVTPQRAVGVVYDPGFEKYNYVPSLAARRYDALLYFERSEALHPLHTDADKRQMPETFPFSF